MANVIVFEKDKTPQLATVIDDTELVSRKNIKDFRPCTEEELSVVPVEILEFCKETAPKLLYRTEGGWISADGESS